MSYRTRYKLECSSKREGRSYAGLLRDEYEAANLAIGESGKTNERCAWHTHEEDMRDFSSKYPGVLFTLSGSGDGPRDLWKKYFRGGKMQAARAKITFDECAI